MESKTKELVKAGHELVVLLGNQYGMIDAASLVQRLTAQLDITAAALREKSKECDKMAAECSSTQNFLRNGPVINKGGELLAAHQFAPSVPTTDAWQRELRQKAWAEGIYFTANRLLAAWEHGFIDSPDREVADVARMILGAVEMLPDATEGDFTREFADEMLALIAKQLPNEVTPQNPNASAKEP